MNTRKNQFHSARKKDGLTLIKLAAKADVSLPALRLIERGKYGNLTTLEKVAKALNKKVTITLHD